MIGMFVFVGTGEFYQTGEIVSLLAEGYFALVKIGPINEGPQFHRVFPIESFANEECFLFETEAQLNLWIELMSEPATVLPFAKGGK